MKVIITNSGGFDWYSDMIDESIEVELFNDTYYKNTNRLILKTDCVPILEHRIWNTILTKPFNCRTIDKIQSFFKKQVCEDMAREIFSRIETKLQKVLMPVFKGDV